MHASGMVPGDLRQEGGQPAMTEPHDTSQYEYMPPADASGPAPWAAPPAAPFQPPRQTRHRRARAAALVLIVAAVAGAGVAAGVLLSRPAGQSAAAAQSPTPASTLTATAPWSPPAPTYSPSAKDFTLDVKVTEQKCFGSAGCNVKFHVELTYAGLPLDPNKTYELVYRIDGTEDAYVNSLTLTGSKYTADESEFVQTKSSKSTLAAVVTDVSQR